MAYTDVNSEDRLVQETFGPARLLAELHRLIAPLEQWTEKEQTQAEVGVFILDHVYQVLPEPSYTVEDKQAVAELVYRHIWQQMRGFAAWRRLAALAT